MNTTTLDSLASHPLDVSIGWTLIHFVWQATVVGIVVAISLRMMRRSAANARYVVACVGLLLMTVGPTGSVAYLLSATDDESNNSPKQETQKMAKPEEFLQQCVGEWQGMAKTWFEPGKLADESKVTGEIKAVLNGKFFRHAYNGSMQGKPRHGEETIALNGVTNKFQIAWIDDFHMNYAIMISEGDAIEKGFSVFGKYDTAPDQPQWGWRTTYELHDKDHLTITAYNVAPNGEEAKAVETVYERRK